MSPITRCLLPLTLLVALLVPAGGAQGVLYFSEDNNANGLYSLDTATGAATNLGASGVTSSTVGLCPSNDPQILYGSKWGLLMQIPVSGAGATDVGGVGTEGLAWDFDTNTLYGGINGSFFTMDENTGAQLATLPAPGSDTEGLAYVPPDSIYGMAMGGVLRRYDIPSNTWSLVANTTLGGWDDGGLAYDPSRNVLYTKYEGSMDLYEVDLVTGAVTTIGSTGVLEGGGLAFVGSGLSCSLTAAAPVAAGDVDLELDSYSSNSPTVDATFDYSLDGGVTWNPCTAAVGSPIANPAVGIATGLATFQWDSLADGVGLAAVAVGVLVQATITDGVLPNPSTCVTGPFDVDNRPPAPTCTLTPPAGVSSGDIDLGLDADSLNSATVDATFEYSLDAGATWNPCTASGASLLPNPATGVPIGLSTFSWGSRTDGVGTVGVALGVLVQVTLDDGVSPILGSCVTAAFDVDNTSLCGGLCGDCNEDSNGPDILDALTAAQIAALLVTPNANQQGCCDVNSSLSIDILDALVIAQFGALLPVTLVCP